MALGLAQLAAGAALVCRTRHVDARGAGPAVGAGGAIARAQAALAVSQAPSGRGAAPVVLAELTHSRAAAADPAVADAFAIIFGLETARISGLARAGARGVVGAGTKGNAVIAVFSVRRAVAARTLQVRVAPVPAAPSLVSPGSDTRQPCRPGPNSTSQPRTRPTRLNLAPASSANPLLATRRSYHEPRLTRPPGSGCDSF